MNSIWYIAIGVIIFPLAIGLPLAGRDNRAGDSANEDVPIGVWGGQHISLELTERGGAVEYDCAHGTIDEKMVVDRRGRFDVRGTQVEERGGPLRENQRPGGFPVRLTGQIKGRNMKLTVTRVDTKKIVGTFNLVHGREPAVVKCK